MKKITLNMLLASLLVLATLASSGCSVRLLDSLTQNRKSEDEVIESVENCYYQYRDEIERFAKFLYSQDNIKQLCIYSPRRGAAESIGMGFLSWFTNKRIKFIVKNMGLPSLPGGEQ